MKEGRVARECRICIKQARWALNARRRQSQPKKDRVQPFKTRCINGHLRTKENTSSRRNGVRVCLECKREWHRSKRKYAERRVQTDPKWFHLAVADAWDPAARELLVQVAGRGAQ